MVRRYYSPGAPFEGTGVLEQAGRAGEKKESSSLEVEPYSREAEKRKARANIIQLYFSILQRSENLLILNSKKD